MVNQIQQFKNLVVFVIRPEPGASRVAAAINAIGGKALTLPVMEIAPNPDYVASASSVKGKDIAIFVSVNAVKYALAGESDSLNQALAVTPLAVIGQSTAQSLVEFGLEPDILPDTSDFTSEALLKSPKLQQVQDKKIVIYRGIGGRNKLAKELKARGAQVSYCEVYQRQLPKDFDRDNFKVLSGNFEAPDNTKITKRVILCSSVELMKNLLELAGQEYSTIVKDTPLLVMSKRIQEAALQAGFGAELLVSENATDQAVIKCLQKWQTAQEI